MRTIPGMEEYLDPLDSIINEQFLPALLGTTITEQERQLFKLPVKDGGLGIPVLVEKANIDFQSSKFITAPLVAVIVSQDYNILSKDVTKQVRSERVRQLNDCHKQQLDLVDSQLNEGAKRAIKQNREKGASSWLSALPLRDHGFTLNKEEFRDALALRYNRTVTNLPSKCACSEIFNVNHAMNCKKGGFVSIRHDTILIF